MSEMHEMHECPLCGGIIVTHNNEDKVASLTKQRNELLETCKIAEAWLEDLVIEVSLDDAAWRGLQEDLDNLRAAIAVIDPRHEQRGTHNRKDGVLSRLST